MLFPGSMPGHVPDEGMQLKSRYACIHEAPRPGWQASNVVVVVFSGGPANKKWQRGLLRYIRAMWVSYSTRKCCSSCMRLSISSLASSIAVVVCMLITLSIEQTGMRLRRSSM